MSAKLDLLATSCVPSDGAFADQVDRILRSETFRGSEILRNLLSFLLSSALSHPAEPLKVKEIARNVFGRSENFDSQSDSVVRVHTGRLRSKLAEYYMTEGADDEVIVTIPKGVYTLSCHLRQGAPASAASATELSAAKQETFSAQPELVRPVPAKLAPAIPLRLALVLALVVAGALCAWAAVSFWRHRTEDRAATPGLKTFWQPFLTKTEPPLIVFSNFRFTGSIASGLQRYDGTNDAAQPVIDTYTTMGEVLGVFEVGRLLTGWKQPVRAKRSRLLTWDEAKDTNLIFVGGPLAETPLRDVQVLKELQFKDGPISPQRKSGAILNLHPRPGEDPVYYGWESSPGNTHPSFDYAVIALEPALSPGHHILVLAGITEFGTEGAAEFVTREDKITELLSKLNRKAGDPVVPFEALLRVQIEGGVPLQSKIVLLHEKK
jgi:hypothetical protein